MNLAPQLPTVLGAFSAMLIAFLSLLNGTSPTTCLIKSLSAFFVFSGLGLILRYALLDASSTSDNADAPAQGSSPRAGAIDVIVPGTSVAELLATQSGSASAGNTGANGEAERQAA